MGTKMFAAIDVGSYELNLKIFEFLPDNRMKEIDSVRYGLDLGTDTFTTGKLPTEKINELCKILKEFALIMKSYKVTAYQAYGTSAIRETKNTKILLDQVEQRTGIHIEVLSNSRQRFLDYKSVASKGDDFDKIIEKGTAIVDIGGGSIQVSLFDHDTLIATQNMKLGVLRLREYIQMLAANPSKCEMLLDEMIGSQLAVFKKLYLKDREIENMIVVDDYISLLLQKKKIGSANAGYIESSKYEQFLEKIKNSSSERIRKEYDIADENMLPFFISAVIIKQSAKVMGANLIWAPGVTLCDGIAYEYGEKSNLLKPDHNFEEDIIACAQNISKRYMGSKKRSETLEKIALTIFDTLKKAAGLSARDRLLLRLCAILHDCGKYISLYDLGTCSYNIIMATEIIGLSHEEREIVANVVKFNHQPFEYYEQMARETLIDNETYMRITKLTAILRVANGLDRSHKQKFKNITTTIREHEFLVTVYTNDDITLEKGLFKRRADFFEEVFSLRPLIKQVKEI
ncbi:MAG: HD domain-containing protein [Lachnospiraceae bacterium]